MTAIRIIALIRILYLLKGMGMSVAKLTLIRFHLRNYYALLNIYPMVTCIKTLQVITILLQHNY